MSLYGTIIFPTTCKYIGLNAFWGCSQITSLYIYGNTSIHQGAFYKCTNLSDIYFGSEVWYIDKWAFAECYSLTGTITIPPTVTAVKDDAFVNSPCTVYWNGNVIHYPDSSAIDRVIAIARAEADMEYHEKASNRQLDDPSANSGSGDYTKYAAYFDNLIDQGYYYFNGKKNGYNWCAIFVNWCFAQAFGCDNAHAMLFQPSSQSYAASCSSSRNYYVNAGRFGSEPRVGAQIIFYDSNSSTPSTPYYHTGLVYKVDDNYVYTVEGNISNKVGYKRYSRSTTQLDSTHSIAGYGYPDYGS